MKFYKNIDWNNLTILAFSGFSGSGKSTIREIVSSEETLNQKVSVLSMTEFVRDCASGIFQKENLLDLKKGEPVSDDQKMFQEFWKGRIKKKPFGYRLVMEGVGEGLKKVFGDGIWANVFEFGVVAKMLKKAPEEKVMILVPEIRYITEMRKLEMFRDLGANVRHYILFRKESIPEWAKIGLNPAFREDLEIIRYDLLTSRGEYEWCTRKDYMFTGVLTNDGTKEELRENVLSIINNTSR